MEGSSSALTHFKSILWVSALLSRPGYTITTSENRNPKLSTEDSLFAETLNTTSTIPHFLTLFKNPPQQGGDPWIEEVLCFVTLGSGLNGGVRLLHGGIITTLMDDAMGVLLTVNKDQGGLALAQTTVTAKMEVKFLKPVETPCTVVVAARCSRREGRKFWIEADVRDGGGSMLAKAEALWITFLSRGKL